MKVIEYRITYGNTGYSETVTVQARDINSGFAKALKKALKPLGNGTKRPLHSIEFSMVKS